MVRSAAASALGLRRTLPLWREKGLLGDDVAGVLGTQTNVLEIDMPRQ